MTRHTSFRFCLDPTVEQQAVLSRHVGTARFAFNQCLHTVKSALTARRTDPTVSVPWSGFDLINQHGTAARLLSPIAGIRRVRSVRAAVTATPP
ncbi:helix-turn-helix domain-containing protein [Nocardia sp. NPDC049707]|uniref:helix-turn-helix domain-containing protein n=1 Tax=Nocardia sp. NPDC049707 TaxID=3154735 RepID=UPI003438BF49